MNDVLDHFASGRSNALVQLPFLCALVQVGDLY